MKGFIASVLSLVYPKFCLTCGKPLGPEFQDPVCNVCWGSIRKNEPAFSYKLDTQHFDRAYSVCVYEGVIKECVHFLKYNAKLSLARPLAELMAVYARYHLGVDNIDFLVPVPLHPAKQREREFNQTEILARRISKILNIPVMVNNLKRVKNSQPQTKLSGAERLINIKGAFEVKDKAGFKNKSVLLIDDVFTTGATVDECAKTLKQAGAKKVEVLTLAKGQ